MHSIDFALSADFIDPADGVPRQLRFECRYNPTPDTNALGGVGQLIAVVAKGARPDNGHRIPISRSGVTFEAVEDALNGWQQWAHVGENAVNLAAIRRRIHDAGLGPI